MAYLGTSLDVEVGHINPITYHNISPVAPIVEPERV